MVTREVIFPKMTPILDPVNFFGVFSLISHCASTWLKEGSLFPLPTDTTRRRPSEAGGEGRTLRGVGAANGTLIAFAGRTPSAGVNLESLSWANAEKRYANKVVERSAGKSTTQSLRVGRSARGDGGLQPLLRTGETRGPHKD